MKNLQLFKGTLVKRYKRFLVDIVLENNETIVAHCPNSGSMMGLLNTGNTVYVSLSNNPANKLLYKLELIEDHNGILVGINTMLTNKLVYEALLSKKIPELAHFTAIKPEYKYLNSRFDFFLTNQNDEKCFLEVKNVTLTRTAKLAEFPDAQTERGAKHLKDLAKIATEGIMAVNLYVVQRGDIEYFSIAKDLDPLYHDCFIIAKESGVLFLCYLANVSLTEVVLQHKVAII